MIILALDRLMNRTILYAASSFLALLSSISRTPSAHSSSGQFFRSQGIIVPQASDLRPTRKVGIRLVADETLSATGFFLASAGLTDHPRLHISDSAQGSNFGAQSAKFSLLLFDCADNCRDQSPFINSLHAVWSGFSTSSGRTLSTSWAIRPIR